MNRTLVLATFAATLLAFSPKAFAITDYYSTAPGTGSSDGLDDVWQSIYNGWGLNPGDDEDLDGTTNLVESLAGTDPRKASDCLKVGNMAISATNVVFSFTAEKGKRYKAKESASPTGPWTDVSGLLGHPSAQGADISTLDHAQETLTIARPAGSAKFYKLETSDVDSDGDGISDWAEGKIGSNPGMVTSPTNASGGAASDGDTLHSLLTLSAAPVQTGYEVADASATTTSIVPAKFGITRSFGTMPLTIPISGSPGVPSDSKSGASAGEYTFPGGTTINIPSGGAQTGAPLEVTVNPVKDSNVETIEYVKVTLGLPGAGAGITGPSAMVPIGDAVPALAANKKLFVAFLGVEAGVTSTATGLATALVAGDNDSASVSISFSNLSSAQNTAYIRVGADNEVLQLPLGQVGGANWNIRAANVVFTDQAMLNALFSGDLYVIVSSANYPNKEISGHFQLSNGSSDFDPGRPDLVAPTYGAPGWPTLTAEQLDRDIYRLLAQSTFGATTESYNEVKAAVDAAVGSGGTYLDGFTNWLNTQMSLQPINFTNLVMEADNEEFMLRNNKPITSGSDPQYYGGRSYGVSYDANGKPTVNYSATNNTFTDNHPFHNNRRREWWTMILQSKDQVRQRMALALSEILVISENDGTILNKHYGCANYWDVLAQGAFGKYRDLLEKVTLSPMMGVYLSHIGNRAAYDSGGGLIVSPDENYAREIMQLFSIGLVLRHPDGSLVLGVDGLPISTYDQTDIGEMARVMTGFTSGARHTTAPVQRFGTNGYSASNPRVGQAVQINLVDYTSTGRDDGDSWWQAPMIYPMAVLGRSGSTTYHDFGAKTLFAGKAGETAVPAQTITSMTDAQTHVAAKADLTIAHNALAGNPSGGSYNGHQNTPVNISRWLIQRFVTSNPSAGYIYRVSEKYRTTNGNLGEVVKSILLDYEARSLGLADNSVSFGKVREPMIHYAGVLRSLHAFSGAPVANLRDMDLPFGVNETPMPTPLAQSELDKLQAYTAPSLPAGWAAGPWRFRFGETQNNFGQSPQKAPSVFNWFLPDYVVPGPMSQAGLFAPEMQISTDANEVSRTNWLWNWLWSNTTGMATQPGNDNNVSDFVANSNNAAPLFRAFRTGNDTDLIVSLTFNSGNWNTAQDITLTSVNNSILSGLTASSLLFSVSTSGTTDPAFQSLTVPPLNVSVTDDEKVNEGVIVTPTGNSTWVAERLPSSGLPTSDTFTVYLTAPPAANVTVNITTGGQTTVSPTSLTFTSGNWSTPQTVTVTAVDDAVAEGTTTNGNHTDNISFTTTSSAANYNGLAVASLPVNVVDNENPGVIVMETGSPNTTDVTEGGATDTLSVVLTKLPSASVTVTPASSNTGSGVTVTGALTFSTANWSTPQNVTVTATNDSTQEHNHTANVTFTVANGGYTMAAGSLPVTAYITDNDNRVIVKPSGVDNRAIEGGLTDTFTVELRTGTVPTSNVYINMGSNQVKTSPTYLTFTPANYNVPQTVTITAIDDMDNEGLQAATLTFYTNSTDNNYQNQTVPVMNVAVVDNDLSRVVVTESGGSTNVSEDGVTDTYTLVLTQAPTADVTVTLTPNAQVTVSPAGPIVFTSANWNTPRTITVAAVNDTTMESDHVGSITHAVSSTDKTYNGKITPTVLPQITDNELMFNVSHTNLETRVTESGTTDTFTIAPVSTPTSAVTVTLVSDGQISFNPSVLTFTSTSAQTVTVTAFDDSTPEGLKSSYIGFTVTSAAALYNGASVPPLLVTVVDNDQAGVNLVESSGNTTPTEGGTDTYTIALTKAPTANVVVTMASSNTTTGATVTSTLTFTTTNWATAQTVTVTALSDGLPESRHNCTISHTVTSTDAAYNGFSIAPVTVLITDGSFRLNESIIITQPGSNNTYVAENGITDTITVQLAAPPYADVTLTPTASTIVSYNPPFLVFNASNWNTPQTMTIAAFEDTAVEGNHTQSVTLTATSLSALYNGLTAAITANVVDNDKSGVMITESGGSTNVTEGGATDTYTVVLTYPPNGNVTISNTSGSTSTGVTVSPATLTFTTANWNTPQTVTVTAVNDSNVEANHTTTVSHAIVAGSTTDTSGYNTLTGIQQLTAFITDNDNRIIVTETGAGTRLKEDGSLTDTYTVVLRSAPTGNVTVTPANAGPNVTLNPTSLSFNSGNWSTPQTITVTAVDNGVRDRLRTTNITHTSSSSDSLYNLQTIATVTATIISKDAGQVVVTESSGTAVSEYGTSDTYTLVLSQPPASPVTVTLTPDSQVTVTPAGPLVFDSSNWFTPVTITVRAVADHLVEGTHYSSITHTVSSSDPVFNNVVTSPVNSIITDGEVPGIIVTQTGGSTVLAEGGVTDTYSIQLAVPPTADVTVALTPNAQVSVSPAGPLVFTAANWNTPQVVTVTAVDDAILEGNHTGVVNHQASSVDTRYHGMTGRAILPAITDNDAASLVITETGGSSVITEGGANDTLSFKLSQPPAAGTTVTITLHPIAAPAIMPAISKQFGYYTNDLPGSNQQKDRIVLDYTELILLYRSTFYGSIATAYGGSVPAVPSNASIQNGHWAAAVAVVDKLDLLWGGGSLKARFPVLVDPNAAPPVPLPDTNPRQVIIDAMYNYNGFASYTRFAPAGTFVPNVPPADTFNTEIRDRCRSIAYLMSINPGATVAK